MVRTGLEKFLTTRRRDFKTMRIGPIVNPSSVSSRLEYAADLLIDRGFNIPCLFAPEHGLWSSLQDQIKERHTVDKRTGLKVYSLYQLNKKPTKAMVDSIDALLYDVQDIGTRYYTFIWTMALGMEACARYGKRIIVLDRPNPLNGQDTEGPVLNPAYTSFVGLHPVPVRHGLTVGEMARWLKATVIPDCDLTVIPMQGWRRSQWFDQTGLPWVQPSPNMPTLETAVVYPGMCLFEGTTLSEGRGATRPFEVFGAPYIDPYALAERMKDFRLRGVRFRPLYFMPTFHKHAGKQCGGLQLHVHDRKTFRSVAAAAALLQAVWEMYPKKAVWRKPPYEDEKRKMPIDILAGYGSFRQDIQNGTPLAELTRDWSRQAAAFRKQVRPYLLYR